MKKALPLLAAVLVILAGFAAPATATSYMIGDNDGYGIGILDGANHPWPAPIHDGRSAAEMAATDGAQYTDTYSTTQLGYSPQAGTVASFLFTGLGNAWTIGHLEIDMADFQASTFGAVITTFNGIVQNFAYNDGFPHTVIHHFDLTAAVLATINATGQLIITIDRNNSGDFYGFDYLSLNDFANPETRVPEPASVVLLGLGLSAAIAGRRKAQQVS
jgi:hypothetical protein